MKGKPMTENKAAAATPRGLRMIVALAGRRNAGKSSLVNAITGQEVAIVSEQAGTTTDAVAKPYELLPLGPVTFYDTAGLDDTGELGGQRAAASRKVLYRSDMVLMVVGEDGLTAEDKRIATEIKKLGIPLLAVFNKADKVPLRKEDADWCRGEGLEYIRVSAKNGENIAELKEKIVQTAPDEFKKDRPLAGDLINAGETAVLVVPIDLEAPKGRLILPQVQVLREILDKDAIAVTVKEDRLADVLNNLKQKPALVITDSQVVQKVAEIVPEEIPLTTFSTLFARNKGDLPLMVKGAEKIDDLCDGDKILIAEACSHHVQLDDIGKVKIPRWMEQYTGKKIVFDFCAGHDFPENLEEYALVVHCGACMLNRTEVMRRIRECAARGVPVTNYGVAISKLQGVLPRIIKVF